MPIIACRGATDKIVSESNMIAWQTHGKAAFHFHKFQGGHFYLQNNVAGLCQMLSNYLINELIELILQKVERPAILANQNVKIHYLH